MSNFSRWQYFAAAFLAYLSLFGVLVSLETPFGTLRLIDIGLIFWTLSTCFWILPDVLQNWRKLWLPCIAVLYLLCTTFLFAPHLASFVYIARWVVSVYSAWSLHVWLSRRPTHVTRWISLWSITFVGLGIAQYLLLPDPRIFFYIGWDDHLFRAFGTLLDPLFFGLVSSLIAWKGAQRLSQHSKMGAILFVSGLLGVAFSYSRLAILATVLWIALEWLSENRTVLTQFTAQKFLKSLQQSAALLSILFLLVVLSPKDGGGEGQKLLRTRSLTARTEAAQSDITNQNSSQDFFLGSGWYTRSEISDDGVQNNARLADSAWLQIWLSGGVVGVVLFAVAIHPVRRNPVVWWHLIVGLVSVSLFSPWVLVASAMIGSNRDSSFEVDDK